MYLLVNWTGCVLHACLLHKPAMCFGVPVKWSLSCLCFSPKNSESSGSPASPRPNEQGKGRGGAGCTVGKMGGGGELEEINC